jgi:AraC-like DNA-binding protein
MIFFRPEAAIPTLPESEALMSTIFSERLFAKHAIEFRPFLAEVGLPAAILDRPDIEIPIEKYTELLEVVARNSNPSIGLVMGQSIEPADLGVYGHAMAAAADVAQMLAVMSQYLYVFAQANRISVETGQNRTIISYRYTLPQVVAHQQDVEFATTAILTMLKNLTGREIRPRYVDFGHSRPEYSRLHSQIFNCEVRFGRRGNRIHLGKNVLDLPILSADQSLFNALELSLAEQLKIRSDEEDLVMKVNHLISVSLGDSGADIRETAKKLGVSHRTLQRRLVDEGCVFSEMVENIRKATALEYVQFSDYSFIDIALMVGYGEQSSLSRAVKRWTGKTPQQIRGG